MQLIVDGLQVQFNPAEVSAVQYISLQDLKAQMAAEPDKFTQWFREEISLLRFFGVADAEQHNAAAGDPNMN